MENVEFIHIFLLSWKGCCLLSFTLGNCIDFDLGMESGAILDSQLTASSELNPSTLAKNGRLNAVWSSWCASTNDSNPYLQIDLQTLHIICAVSTQGNFQGDQWVESYTLQASTDGTIWTYYKNGGQVEVNGRVVSTCLGILGTRRLQASVLCLGRSV